jgi:hypothetical protein
MKFDKLYIVPWKSNFWYTRVTSNGGPCTDDGLESDHMST